MIIRCLHIFMLSFINNILSKILSEEELIKSGKVLVHKVDNIIPDEDLVINKNKSVDYAEPSPFLDYFMNENVTDENDLSESDYKDDIWPYSHLASKNNELAYRHGERTLALREFMNSSIVPVPEYKLVQNNSLWYLHGKKVVMSGIGRPKLMKDYTYVRTSDGKWHAFYRAPRQFRHFIAKLPYQYESGRLSFDGQVWFVKNSNGDYRKLIKGGKEGMVVKASDEDEVWHKFTSGTVLNSLVEYLNKLNNSVCSYKEGDATKGLREILERKANYESNELLEKNDQSWYIPGYTGNASKIVMQGLSRGRLAGECFFGLAQDNTWHVFRNPSKEFKQYLRKLPKQYDDNYLSFDGDKWYVKNKQGQYRKIVHGVVSVKTVKVLDEDNQWHKFPNEPIMAHLIDYLAILNVEDYLIFDNKHSGDESQVEDPVKGLGKVIKGRATLPSAETYLTELDGIWFVMIPETGDNKKIIARGYGIDKLGGTIIAMDEDDKWYKFSNAPIQFRAYASKLPKQYDYQNSCFDGENWFAKEPSGLYRKLNGREVNLSELVAQRGG